jgi:membrane protein DedA with SNARE-associated domain
MPSWIENHLSDTNPSFYPVVFLSLLLAGLGFPISADLVLLTIGYIAYRGHADYGLLIGLSIAGILLSDTGMFFIGKIFGTRLTNVWPFRKALTPERIARAEMSFRKQGYRVVFLARFMPGIRTVFMFTSGVLGLRYTKFLAYDLAGALIVVPLTIYSVRWAAGNKDAILSALQRGQWLVLGIAALGFIGYFLRRGRARGSSGTRSAPASLER